MNRARLFFGRGENSATSVPKYGSRDAHNGRPTVGSRHVHTAVVESQLNYKKIQ